MRVLGNNKASSSKVPPWPRRFGMPSDTSPGRTCMLCPLRRGRSARARCQPIGKARHRVALPTLSTLATSATGPALAQHGRRHPDTSYAHESLAPAHPAFSLGSLDSSKGTLADQLALYLLIGQQGLLIDATGNSPGHIGAHHPRSAAPDRTCPVWPRRDVTRAAALITAATAGPLADTVARTARPVLGQRGVARHWRGAR
jgi:hypothetical protein